MKRIFLVALISALLACALAFSAYAAEIDYTETATLADGTLLPIYDDAHNPLIWYVSGTDENGAYLYESVPNNRSSANADNDTYVTYTINTSWMTQLENINIHIWNEDKGEYDVFTEETLSVVVVNLRGVDKFEYIHRGLKTSDIQYVYFNEGLRDFCEYFKGSTALRLVDLSVCTNLTGGLGGARNFFNCTSLHTIRLAPGASYALTCTSNSNWRFSNTAIVELVVPANVTSIGVDNFKNCAQLESIYILGNTTSLGQRNFLGCTSLTSIYILGDNPEIDITSFKENFYECVDGKTTYDFTGIGKYFFFVTENMEYLEEVKAAIGADAIIAYSDYVANPSSYESGRYVISGTNVCDAYYGVHEIDAEGASACAGVCNVCGDTIVNHVETENLSVSMSYANMLANGEKITACNNKGCTYRFIESVKPLFKCLGYSATESGAVGIAVGFMVNNEALAEYTAVTGKTVKYGVFAVLQEKLGSGEAFDENGVAANGVISAEISGIEYSVFTLKITGFTEEQKTLRLAMGAYVCVTGDGVNEYSYLQADEPLDGEAYSYISYKDVTSSSQN